MNNPLALAGLFAVSLSVSAVGSRVGIDLRGILGKEEMKALEALQAAGGGQQSVNATVDTETRQVNLHFHRALTAGDTPHLRQISKLKTLFFAENRYPLSDESLWFLDGVGMTGLVISHQPITDDGLRALKLFPKLTHLTLFETKVTSAGLAFLKDTPQPLKELTIEQSDVTDDGLMTIGQIGSLESIRLLECDKITDEGISHLRLLANLKKLLLNKNKLLTSGVMAHLRAMKHLTRIELDAMLLEPEDLYALQGLDCLEAVSFAKTNVTDDGINYLVPLKSLKQLNLQDTKITDGSLALLGEMKQLTSLEFGKTKITDGGLARLSGLTALKTLGLSGTKVSDAGLAALRELTQLERLNLDGTAITDGSIDILVSFKRLSHLSVKGTVLSAAGVKRIEAVLPKCTLVRPKAPALPIKPDSNRATPSQPR